ncbi:MAG: polysaccharide pyruvyl transferase family protein [Aureliella sp.]
MQFISRINGISNVTTVRDKIAHRIVSDCGGTAELLACTAFLSGCSVAPKWNQTSKILINYMEGGGHFDWGQGIDASEYAAEFAKFAAELSEKFDLYWLAHNQEEAIAARRFGCKSDRLLFPKNLQEYLGLPEKFRAAICNRMHASIGLASMGIPSIAIGNDTRLAMVDQIGLKTRYTKTLSFSTLRDDFSVLLDESSSESARLLELRSSTLDRYVNLLRRYV